MVISHNLNDVFEVADRVAVLYLGGWWPRGGGDFDRQSVVEYQTTVPPAGGSRSHRDPDSGETRPGRGRRTAGAGRPTDP